MKRLALPLCTILAAASFLGCDPEEEKPNGEEEVLTEPRLIVLDGLAGTASLIDLGETLEARAGRWQLGEVPNSIVVEGDRAIIVNSGSHTVQVIDLLAAPGEATIQEVFLGDGTNPMSLAMISDDVALVSLFLTNQLATVDLKAGRVTACVDLPTGEELRPLEGMEPEARPQSIELLGDGRALVTFNNMDVSWQPAGHGIVALVDLRSAADLPSDQEITCGPSGNAGAPPSDAPTIQRLIDLGDDCLVPGFIEVGPEAAYVTCSGTWGLDEGRMAIIDKSSLAITGSIHLGGMPGPMITVDDRLVIADGSDGRVFMTGLDGEVIHDFNDPIILCPSDFDAGLFQFVSDLAPAPEGEILASCFSSSEVLRFSYEQGAEDDDTSHARITGRVVSGDGAGSMAIWEAAE